MISVVMPAYNASSYVVAALASVLCWTLSELEVIFIDDCSGDDTLALVEGMADPRLLIIRHERNLGVSAARNSGLAVARGDYIMFLDADDIAMAAAWVSLLQALEDAPDAVAAYGRTMLFEGDFDAGGAARPAGLVLPSGSILPRLVIANDFLSTGTLLIRHASLKAVGPFRTVLGYGEDWEMWCRLAATGDFIFKDVLVHAYRRHPASASMRAPTEQGDASLAAVDMIFHNPSIALLLGKRAPGLRRQALGWRQFIWGRKLLRRGHVIAAAGALLQSSLNNPAYFFGVARRWLSRRR